jgi:tetratricopeptide (TPR) repeat protein
LQSVTKRPEQARWKQVEDIFCRALEQPAESVRQWLEEACAGDPELISEVVSLLESDRVAEGFVASAVESAVCTVAEDNAQVSPMSGRRIGSYRLIRELGTGGMGTVYLAVRADDQYESEVAIKLVRPGLDTDFVLRRFRRERQILARLEHPNITRLLDGGTTEDGIPWFVMEYIEGSWITRYAAERSLSLEDRIRLILPVCDAVHFAHRNFVVHRDLKPGNILIDSKGVPKLLDFGISTLLVADRSQAANTEAGMMTPDYACPEQILGEPVTVSSDVYSLGAVLYELITGIRPHRIEQCSPLALERAICTDPITVPSHAVSEVSLSRRLRGDLDNIVLRAMQKEPGRRYESAERLAEDLRRFLEHRPVLARPDSLVYRASRFVRRNYIAVALSAVAAIAVLAGTIVAWREANLADERFQEAKRLATAFVFDVDEAARGVPGATRVRHLIASTGVEYLNGLARKSSGDWSLKRELAAAYLRIGEVQGGTGTANLGETAAALSSFRAADALLAELLRHSPADRAAADQRMDAQLQIARLLRETGQYKDATAAARTGLGIADPMLAARSGDLDAARAAGRFHEELARLAQIDRRMPDVQSECAAALRLLRQVAAARPGDRTAQNDLADVLGAAGSYELSVQNHREALADFRAQSAIRKALCDRYPTDPALRRESMLSYGHLGDVLGNPEYENLGDTAGAFAAYTQMVEQAKSLHDADPADIRALGDHGIALFRLGLVAPDFKVKRGAFVEAYSLLTRAAAGNPQSANLASYKSWVEAELGTLSLASHDRPAAIRYYRDAIATAEAYLRTAPSETSVQKGLIVAGRALAEEQARSGERAQALATLESVLAVGRSADGRFPAPSLRRANVARSWQAAGAVYALLGDRATAKNWYTRSLAEWHALESQKGFQAPLRKEMESAMRAAEVLR